MIVVSPSGAQPSRARKFISAGAMYPASRNSSTEIAPCRFESFFRPRRRCSGRARRRAARPRAPQDDDLLRRVRDVVVAADHVRDPVQPVLDRRREVVGRPAVGADDHQVLELRVRELDPALDGVVPADHALLRHPDPDRAVVLVRLTLADEPRPPRRQRSAPSSWNRVSPSHSIPSQRSERSICSTASSTSRLVSVFSIRSRHSPPRPRAKSQLKRNVRTPPMWRNRSGSGPCGRERSSGARYVGADDRSRDRSSTPRSERRIADRHRASVGCSSAPTCRLPAASGTPSTAARRSAATRSRSSPRARACGGRRTTHRRRSRASGSGEPKRESRASSVTRSISSTSPRPTARSARSRRPRCVPPWRLRTRSARRA